jgi:hypothetical protein
MAPPCCAAGTQRSGARLSDQQLATVEQALLNARRLLQPL